MMIKDVHTEHCCAIHGCKYDSVACTVISCEKRQSFMCETCDYVLTEHWDVIQLMNEMYDRGYARGRRDAEAKQHPVRTETTMAGDYDTTQLALVLESWMIDKLRETVVKQKQEAERRMTANTFGESDVIALHEANEILSALSSPEYVS